LPTAPYHIIDLGGSTAEAGLFLGFLAFASAVSAPFTGSIGDRLGQRRVLIVVSLALAAFTLSYTFIHDHRLLLALVVAHGLVWSALLSAQGAYMTHTIPASRRAEGLGYWGLASVFAMAGAPSVGFWVYQFGWAALTIELTVLNLLMAIVAWRLPDDRTADHAAIEHPPHYSVEWRVLLLSVTMALISFSYGALTSFSSLFADDLHLRPRSLFLTAMAAAVLIGRLTVGRWIDQIGHRRVLVPCMLAPPIGIFLLSVAQGWGVFLASAMVFGAGFGLMYPAYTAFVMAHVSPLRRGAAFGAMLAAFDTGIGSGSSAMGWLVHHVGFRWGFAGVAAVAALALPCFLYAEARLGFREGVVPPTVENSGESVDS
jgi:MFS family permease